MPAEDGKLRLWRGTAVAGQLPGGVATLTDDTVGYEWDEDLDNGARPAGLVRMSSTTVSGVDKLQDHGSTYATGTATHHLTLYRDTNGAGRGRAGLRRRHGPVVLGPRRRPRSRQRDPRTPRCSRPP